MRYCHMAIIFKNFLIAPFKKPLSTIIKFADKALQEVLNSQTDGEITLLHEEVFFLKYKENSRTYD